MSDINWNDLTKDELIDILRDNNDAVIGLIEKIGRHEFKHLNEETQRQIIIKLINTLEHKEYMIELFKIYLLFL